MAYQNWYELEQAFADLLNETNDPFKVGNLEYEFARSWEAIDPIAYYLDLLAFADSEGVDTDTLKGSCSVNC